MNDHDVIASKGKESLKRLHASALALLDLAYTRDDLALLVRTDAGPGKEVDFKHTGVARSLVELLDFRPLSLMFWSRASELCQPKLNGGVVPSFEHLVLFDEEKLCWLEGSAFSPQNDSDLAWVLQRARERNAPSPRYRGFRIPG